MKNIIAISDNGSGFLISASDETQEILHVSRNEIEEEIQEYTFKEKAGIYEFVASWDSSCGSIHNHDCAYDCAIIDIEIKKCLFEIKD